MNRYETNSSGAIVNNSPLFASVWLALFNTLRENYQLRRSTPAADANCSRVTDTE